MSLLFTPEDSITTIPIEVNIVRAFTPFTTAQTLLVQPLRQYTFLPPHFVLKLSDPRFSEDKGMSRLFKGGWTTNSDTVFGQGLRRVRSGEWGNHWRILGASVDSRLPDADFDDDDQINWIFEMHGWSGLRGLEEPRLYGSCVYVGDDAAPDMDPIISHVPGLLLEYIDGTPLDKFVVGDNLSKEDSKHISQGCLATLRIIRDNLLVHNDFVPRNVIIRPHDHDFDHPVIIDFGSALLREFYPKMSDDDWISIVTENQEVLDARKQLGHLGYHNPSPIPEYFDMISHNMYCQGHASFNNIVETMRPDWRGEYYERVEDVLLPVNRVTVDGEEYTWYHPRWRIKPGVNTANTSADYMWRSPRNPPARDFCTASSEARRQLSLSQDGAESDVVLCPYTPGISLSLTYVPEAESGGRPIPIDVRITHAFTPFTTAQTLVVQPLQPSPILPPRLILKLTDPRFSEPKDKIGLFKRGWTKTADAAFRQGLQRIRSGEWLNHWRLLGASEDTGRSDDEYDDDDHGDWIMEMDRWCGLRYAHDTELAAFRTLRSLQGSDIPRLYGSCVHVRNDAASDVDPIISHVPGLLLEYIDGQPLDKLGVGDKLSKEDLERIAQGCLATLRKIRDHFVAHNDFAPRNVIVRPHDFDHPVIIDFGSALLRYPGITDEEWTSIIAENEEVLRARKQLGRLGYHNPSPIPEYFEEISHSEYRKGHASFNIDIEDMRPDWRDEYYERVEDVPPPVTKLTEDGREYLWYYPQWRIKRGVKTANASADYTWKKLKGIP